MAHMIADSSSDSDKEQFKTCEEQQSLEERLIDMKKLIDEQRKMQEELRSELINNKKVPPLNLSTVQTAAAGNLSLPRDSLEPSTMKKQKSAQELAEEGHLLD
jgi:DNA gyrase/topoisomerase IV subunit A